MCIQCHAGENCISLKTPQPPEPKLWFPQILTFWFELRCKSDANYRSYANLKLWNVIQTVNTYMCDSNFSACVIEMKHTISANVLQCSMKNTNNFLQMNHVAKSGVIVHECSHQSGSMMVSLSPGLWSIGRPVKLIGLFFMAFSSGVVVCQILTSSTLLQALLRATCKSSSWPAWAHLWLSSAKRAPTSFMVI